MAELNRRPDNPADDPKPSESGGDRNAGSPHRRGHRGAPDGQLRPGDEGTNRDPRVIRQKMRESEALGPDGELPPRPPGDGTDARRRTDAPRPGKDAPRPGDSPRPAEADSPKVDEHSRRLSDLTRQVKYESVRFDGLNQAVGRVERKTEALTKRVDDLAKTLENKAETAGRPGEPDARRTAETSRPAGPDTPADAELTRQVGALSFGLSETNRRIADVGRHADSRATEAERKSARAATDSAEAKQKVETFGERLDQTEQSIETRIETATAEVRAELRAEYEQKVTELETKFERRIAELKAEITGMHLPKGFDDGDVHWLRRYHEVAPDLDSGRRPDTTEVKPDSASLDERVTNGPARERSREEKLPPRDKPAEPDDEDASRTEKLRGKLYEKEFLGDLESALGEWGDLSHDALPSRPPDGHAEVQQPHKAPSPEFQGVGVDGGDALTAVIFTSIAASRVVHYLHRKLDDWKEVRRNGRDG